MSTTNTNIYVVLLRLVAGLLLSSTAVLSDPAYPEDPSSTKIKHKHDKNKSSNYEGGPNSSGEETADDGIWGWILLAVVLWYCCYRRRKTNRNSHRQHFMDENGTVQTGRSSWKTYPICYSPVYYYFKGVFGIYGLVSPIMGWMQYTQQCSEWSTALLPQVWFVTVMVLWGLQGLVHVYFILARFVAKHPPSDHLYDGGIEATLKLPLMIGLALLLVVSILGLNFIHAPASESPACSEVLDDIVKSRAIRYIVLCVLMLLKVGGSNTNHNNHEQEQSVQPATMHYHHSNTNTNTNPPAFNPNAFPVNSTAPVILPLPDAPYQNQNDYGSTKTPASSTVMYSDTTL